MTNNDISDEKTLLDQVLGSRIIIPPQPTILLEIEKLINKPNNQITAIGNLITKDVSLSAAIYKLLIRLFTTCRPRSPAYKKRSPYSE